MSSIAHAKMTENEATFAFPAAFFVFSPACFFGMLHVSCFCPNYASGSLNEKVGFNRLVAYDEMRDLGV